MIFLVFMPRKFSLLKFLGIKRNLWSWILIIFTLWPEHCAFKFPTFMILYEILGLRSLVKKRTKKWWLPYRFVLTITWFYKCASVSSVHSLSHVQLFVTPWIAAHQASLSITNSQSLLKFMFINLVMPSNHLILCCLLLLPPSIFSSIRVFSNGSVLLIRWPKYWSFSISPSNEYSRLMSFRIDWLDLAVQGTLKSLLQHHSSKGSILWCSVFFTVQISHPYMTTGKTIALIRWTFVAKVMSLLFNVLFRLVITFLPRNKGLLISWL